MASYKIETSPNEDREGVQIWIYRDDGACVSLAVAEDWGVFDDDAPVPNRIVQRARALADRVNY